MAERNVLQKETFDFYLNKEVFYTSVCTMCVLLPPLSEIMHPRAVWLEKKAIEWFNLPLRSLNSDYRVAFEQDTWPPAGPVERLTRRSSQVSNCKCKIWRLWEKTPSEFRRLVLQRLQSRTSHLPDATPARLDPRSACVYTAVSTSVYIPPKQSPAEPRWRQASSVQMTGGERWSRTLLTPNQTAAIDSYTLIGPTAGSPQAWNTHTLHLHCQRLSAESSGGNTHTHKGAHTILYTLNGKQWNHKCSECLCALCHSDWRGRRGLVVTPQSKHDGQRGRGGRRVSH